MNIPNMLSGFRLVAAPVLLYSAWTKQPSVFLVLLALSLLSDFLDGWIARHFDCESEFGVKLDSWGDLATYMTVPLCAWWLWPDLILRESSFVLLTLGAYTLPLLAGLLKFGRLPSYHTWSAKGGAVVMGVSAMVLFIAQTPLPFRIAAILQALIALEEIAITIKLPQWQSNVPSLWHVISRSEGAE